MKFKRVSSIFLSAAIAFPTLAVRGYADSSIVKYAGKDRIETSISTANAVDSNTLVLSSAYNFADSLSAFNIAVKNKAKLVLIDNKTDLSGILKGKSKVYIIGGETLLNKNTENKIRSKVSDTQRIAGSNRYDTNRKTLEISGYKDVGAADGRNYPDALSASGLLADKGLGLLLVNGSRSYSTDYNVKYTFGGKNSVSQDGGERIAGRDRYETSRLINQRIQGMNTVVYTSGENYADALSSINLINKGSKTGIVLLKYIGDKDKAGFTSVPNQASVGNLVYKKYTAPKVNGITIVKTSSNPTRKEVDNIFLQALHSGNLDVGMKIPNHDNYTASRYMNEILKSMLYGGGYFETQLDRSGNKPSHKMAKMRAYYIDDLQFSTNEYKEHLDKLRKIIDAAGVKPGDSTRNKAILVAKYLKHHYSYDDDYVKANSPTRQMDINVTGPFTLTNYDKSICSGFTGVYNQIMFMLGIPSYTLEGPADWIQRYDKNGKLILDVNHANPYVYYNKQWHELNVTGNTAIRDDETGCRELFLGQLVQTPEVIEQEDQCRKIYSEYKDFYLKINPDLEKVDNSEDSRWNDKVIGGIKTTLTDSDGSVHVFNSDKEFREYIAVIDKNRKEEYQKWHEEQVKKRQDALAEADKRRKEYEERRREAAEKNMKRQLEVEKEERETRQKNEEYVAIPESEYRRGVVEAINRKRAESGMSPVQEDTSLEGILTSDLQRIINTSSYNGMEIKNIMNSGRLKGRYADVDVRELNGRIKPDELMQSWSIYMRPEYKYVSFSSIRSYKGGGAKINAIILLYGDPYRQTTNSAATANTENTSSSAENTSQTANSAQNTETTPSGAAN